MWEQLPVTEGIFSEEITKIKAPDMASRISALRFSCMVFRMEKKPDSKKGRHKRPQAMQKPPGRYPSIMCMAFAWGAAAKDKANMPDRATSSFSR